MTEIWVPYGPVEVSFDIRQENLSEIFDPQPPKIAREDLDKNLELVSEDSVLLLSGTIGVQQSLDALLSRNKGVRRILYPRYLGALARRKSQDFGVEAEMLDLENLVDVGPVDGSPARVPGQIKTNSKLVALTSIHYDPLFGLTSAASDLVSLSPELKQLAFSRSTDEIPCQPTKSNASWYSSKVLEACGIKAMEVVEKTSKGLLNISYGECEDAHSRAKDYFRKNLSIPSTKSQRVIFGCGGLENDRTLTDALARSFFNVVQNVVLEESDSKVCMLAECSQGLGSEALLRFVTGKFEPRAKLDTVSYFDGLEVLLSFYKVQRDLELTILTTLPKFYASRFDFKTIGGAREAPSSLSPQGSRGKILVVTDASTAYFI